MTRKEQILGITKELVAVQSDTGTAMETAAADCIGRFLAEDAYFSQHPELWGLEKTGDHLGRSVVWALKKGRTGKVVILTGHYDAVEIDCYGALKPWALDPDALKEKILQRELPPALRAQAESPDWMFGRASADMKGGLAIGLYEVLNLPEDSETGILFAAVCDEENLSAGARSMVPFLLRLRERFGLMYQMTVILEPQLPIGTDDFMIYNGSIGKMLPAIVAKGHLAHCGEPLKGLNAAHMIAEIISRVDMNTELMTEDQGLSAQVPIAQTMRDLKTTYDVSIPEYAAACVNLLFLGKDRPHVLLEKIRSLAETAMVSVTERYRKAFDLALSKGLVLESDRLPAYVQVLLMGELEQLLAERRADFDSVREELTGSLTDQVRTGAITLQTAGIAYMKAMLELLETESPAVVIGMVPPYYPCVSNTYFENDSEKQIACVRKTVERKGMKLRVMPFFTGIGDCSYMVCADPAAERELMGHMTLAGAAYDIPFEAAHQLVAPCFFIGPRCRDIHRWEERVYVPDLTENVPEIIEELLR